MDGIEGAGMPWGCDSMSGSPEGMTVSRRPRRFHPRMRLRMLMVLVALVGGLIAFTHRRVTITPGNVLSLAPVATMPSKDIWRVVWSPQRNRMGVLGFGTPVEARDAVSLALLETIREGKRIIHFAFSPKQSVVAYSENDGSKTATILDRKTGTTIRLDAGKDQPDVV